VVDLSDRNPGAYWEAGFARGLGKPVIYVCDARKFDTTRHFDVEHYTTLKWDPAAPTEIADKLKATIRAMLPAEAKLTD
jgi:nucleoside 2-deoxyribosyltransferase